MGRSGRRSGGHMQPVPIGAIWLVWLTVTGLLLAGCSEIDENVAATRTIVSASHSATYTPSGDLLQIDGETVLSVLIPDPAQGALYALTANNLFVLQQGRWVATRTKIDGRKVIVDPRNADRLLRGDRPSCGSGSSDAAIPLEVSEDGGRTWRELVHGRNIRPIEFDRNLPEVVYGTDCGLAISADGGRTWMRVQPMQGFDLASLAATGELLYVLGTSVEGISQVRSINVTAPLDPIISDPLLEIPGKATLDARGGRIVVGAVDAIYISDDAGVTWATSRIGLEGVTSEPTVQPARPPGAAHAVQFGISVIRIEPHNIHRIFAGTAHGLFVSLDDGVTWVRYTQVPIEARVTDIQFGLNDADLFVTTTDGVIVVPSP
jgi:hypothetical protein